LAGVLIWLHPWRWSPQTAPSNVERSTAA